MIRLVLEPLPRNATAGELLRFLCDHTPLDAKLVGKIQWEPRSAVVEISPKHALKVVNAIDGRRFRERRLRVLALDPLPAEAEHFSRLSEWLQKEAAEERRRLQLAASDDTARNSGEDPYGVTLRPLNLIDEDYGLGGRLLLRFQLRGNGELGGHRLGTGAPIVLTQLSVQKPLSFRGIVVERDERSIQIAVEEPDDDLPSDAAWRLDLSADEAGRRRQHAALWRVASTIQGRLAELRAVLLHEEPIRFRPCPTVPSDRLNTGQNAAVAQARGAHTVAVIHGPPGTGKTTTVAEFIRQAVADGAKVLATAPSHAAVDVLMQKLMELGIEPVRLGHPARVNPALRARTLDELTQFHPDANLARKRTREAYAKFREADRWTRDKPDPGEKSGLRHEARELLSEARQLEQNAIEQILRDSSVICATLTGIDSETLGPMKFEWAVIDEACQATEPACWIPILRCERVLMAGDPQQLPPTILSDEARRGGFGISLMERYLSGAGPEVVSLLTRQYRMNEAIMAFPNAEFYDGKLEADASVAGHTLAELPEVNKATSTIAALQFIDTAGASYDEELEESTGSRWNPQEAALLLRKVGDWLAAGVPASAIAIITPYAAQARLLREKTQGMGIEVDSVDGFQGREKEAIAISFVRSNPAGEVGFLADLRRTNVGMTRARRALLMVGDSATLAHEPFYARLIEAMESAGAYRTVWDEPME
ncbi:MAG: AAA domain-containing protein [Gemmataceae bacterium]